MTKLACDFQERRKRKNKMLPTKLASVRDLFQWKRDKGGEQGRGGTEGGKEITFENEKISPLTVKLVTCSTWGLKQGDCFVQEGIRSVRQRKSQ